MWKPAAAFASLGVVVWQASLFSAPHKVDATWAAVLVLLLVGARRGREWAWVLLMALVSTYATAILLGNATNPDVLLRRGLPILLAVAVLGYSSRSAMRAPAASETRKEFSAATR
jgi:hypothetical protein